MNAAHDEPMSEEESSRQYLREHPAYECSLWQEWVLVVSKRRGIAPPTGREWDSLMAAWHHGKMPITSVDELEAMRKAPPNALILADRRGA